MEVLVEVVTEFSPRIFIMDFDAADLTRKKQA
jgi:hypothetical protein